MKVLTISSFCFSILLTAIAGADPTSATGFEQLKSLVGQWQGTLPDGRSVTASYEMISGGTAVMERLLPAKEQEMITVYHPDKDELMLTHYCMANNQPRMKATAPTGVNTLNFSLIDVSNLKSEGDGHMRKLVMTFIDKDHFNAEWTYREKGKETPTLFQFTRIK